jgi:hypothetical protein
MRGARSQALFMGQISRGLALRPTWRRRAAGLVAAPGTRRAGSRQLGEAARAAGGQEGKRMTGAHFKILDRRQAEDVSRYEATPKWQPGQATNDVAQSKATRAADRREATG